MMMALLRKKRTLSSNTVKQYLEDKCWTNQITMDKAALRLTLFGLLFTCVNLAPKKKQDIDIFSFHINSVITSRYATTVITSRVKNLLAQSQEVLFEVKIPKNAFISQFRMTIEGKTYDGVVKEKEEAQREYSRVACLGQSAGLVSFIGVGRTFEDFKTSVTVAALSNVTFELTYEELLKRQLGKYELLINAQPMQPVSDFEIDVHIHENPEISFLEVKGGLSTKDLNNAVSAFKLEKDAWVKFLPTRKQQTECDDCSENGLNGNLIITYDIKRFKQRGDLEASKGYFVHCFAPTDIQYISNNVVFIIDQSGSMSGKKMEQTRLAMLKILSDLAEDDHFGLITFSDRIRTWKPELLKATKGNVEEAKMFVKGITSDGNTDMNAALLKAVDMINKHQQEGSASKLILLTDGDPTAGETNPVEIQKNIKKAIGGKFPLYCLGFGKNVIFEFLEKLSLENNGVARRIYEDSDADRQLQDFYKGVSTPLLTDVELSYQGVDDVTQNTFSQYYSGSEIVVAGRIIDNSLKMFTTEVSALSKKTKMVYQISVPIQKQNSDRPGQANFTERLWAFLTVKQLLEKEVTLQGLEQNKAKTKAIDLSLKYKFVTPLTSMVVTKPQDQKIQVVHKPKEGEKPTIPPTSSDLVPCEFGGEIEAVMVFLPAHVTTSPPLKSIRILKSSVNAKPLCYDVHHVAQKFRLLQNDLSEFSMNGQLETIGGKGFSQIAIRYKTHHHLLLSTSEISYFDGQDTVRFSWDQGVTYHETEHVSLILRSNKMDVTMGNIRVVILLHKKDEVFLWPAVWQQPKDAGFTGILGEADISYEEIPGSQTPSLKLKDKEVMTSWEMVTDYRLSFAPVVGCWLVPFRVVAQRELSDFTVTQTIERKTYDGVVKGKQEAQQQYSEAVSRGQTTDINAAVLAGVDMINRHPREGTASILILLTDGHPTSGETNIERIMANVKEAIGLKFPLYCLGFGHDVNFDFLTKMSLENGGVARRIYEDSDADLQLQGFYEEVAVPLLTDIHLKYTGGTNLTKTSFTLYFNGSEIVVSGQITDNSVESFTTEVIAVSKGSSVTYQDTVMIKDPSDVPPENEDFMQRLWAYLTVKQLLERQVLLKGQEKEDEEKEALKLSLKYQFVTPLTSMVVTKPQEDEVEVADKPKEGGEDPRPPVMGF
ncbi:inter-alpha-trypsin inhibitor heavy chain H3-like [Ctenopharyngodon idella]|uniref:inter-alpha-trypsin inhibitor heavy chain H3-like n=1 Tax=Ctenopharyngodon idella TaxID=7959 RepID=UPI00222F4719|nr:inter-alpha-trypsin inhibitor heavy chain H3-like [Ctenopharyngodon idella]